MDVEVNTKKRSGWLTAFLILMLIVNPLAAFTYFVMPDSISSMYPNATNTLIYFMGVLCIFNIVLAVGIWKLKRWGVYGFYAVGCLSLVINLYLGIPLLTVIFGGLGALAVYFLTRKNWSSYT